MIFETHAHYDDDRFEKDRDALLSSLQKQGIERVINVGASIESTKTTLALADAYDFVYAAVGVHPSDIDGLNEESFAWLREQTAGRKVAAVGEIGLDYYWEKGCGSAGAAKILVCKTDGAGAGGFSSGDHPFQGSGGGYA